MPKEMSLVRSSDGLMEMQTVQMMEMRLEKPTEMCLEKLTVMRLALLWEMPKDMSLVCSSDEWMAQQRDALTVVLLECHSERVMAVVLGFPLVQDIYLPIRLRPNTFVCHHHLPETSNILQCRNSP
jgi:hypothetical protein